MEWMLLYLMKNPNDQEKVFQEIKTLTDNNGRQVNLGDKANAHFTNAFIDEVTRHFEMGVFPPSHKTLQDVVFQGKNIPKGTQVCVFFNVAVAKKTILGFFSRLCFRCTALTMTKGTFLITESSSQTGFSIKTESTKRMSTASSLVWARGGAPENSWQEQRCFCS